MRRFSFLPALALALSVIAVPPAQAHGWGGVSVEIGGGFFGFPYIPFYAPPPVYYPPPAYYPPPPAYYSPPAYYPPAPAYEAPAESDAQSCDAGQYMCPMDVPATPGTSCYCPGNHGGRVYGHAQ